MAKEENIDVGQLLYLMRTHKKMMGGVIVGCTALSLGLSFVLPKQYESTALVQMRSVDSNGGAAAALASSMGVDASALSSTKNSPLNYVELMKSRHVLEPIIDAMQWEDEDDKPDAEQFAKKRLKIENTKQTNMIKVTAKGKTPEEAQMISQGVVDNFLSMQTENSQQTQSLLVKFLTDRIDQTEQEAEEASRKFADFQREHKMYSPDEEAKRTVQKLDAFDEAIKDIKVGRAENQARLSAVSAKLSEIKSSSLSYNINDNENVQKIRSAIVSEEVNLVGLRQQYTENHPAVKASKNRLEELRRSLVNEVNAAVDSNATTLNPTQSELLKQQAQSEASLAVADATEAAINERKKTVEDGLTDFPQDVVEYMQLQRDANIKNEIYVSLVKECENDKIKEAMDSMDIQVIDPANLPREDKPAWPKKSVMLALGFAVGVIASFGRLLWIYKRRITD